MAEEEAAGAALELGGLPPDIPDELLTLYFENQRRSGGGPVLSWQRLGRGGVLTFQEASDAARVLAQKEHVLQGARLSLRPAPPPAPSRLLLQGLPPGTTPQRLEQHVQALMRATGQPEQPCRALASPRPDRALVQLPQPLSEAEVRELEKQARALDLDGATVSLAGVPQARAVRVVGGTAPADPLLLQLYLENERRSGGGALAGLRSLPGPLGAVVSFQQWQVAERVLQQDHRLRGLELSLVPHYDVLEPEDLAADTGGGDRSATLGPGAAEQALLEAGEPARTLQGVGTVTSASEEAPGPSGVPGRTEPTGSVGPVGAWDQEGLESLGPPGPSGQAEPVSSSPAESPGPVGSVETALGPAEQVGSGSLEPGGSPEPAGLVETVLSMEPGAMRFMQLYHQDLLAGLGDVALFPLEEADVTGFRLCGARAPCQAAEEFLQSLLGSIGSHLLSLRHPGSARFLLGPEGQHLLRELEARFQCVFGTERLAGDDLDTDPTEVDPTEALQAPPGQSQAPWPPDSEDGDLESLSLEAVRELLATLEGLDGEDRPPLELGEEEPEEPPEEEPAPSAREEPQAPAGLEEAAALQLALHRSLEPQGRAAEQEEAAALQQALALSLLEPAPLQAEEELLGGGPAGRAQLVVHADFEQDMEELDRALGAALEGHLREETVGLRGPTLPAELRARLEQRHGVSVALHEDRALLRGFGAQPARAARHLRALLAGPWGQSPPDLSEASSPAGEPAPGTGEGGRAGSPNPPDLLSPHVAGPRRSPEGPLGRLEGLAENSPEFRAVVQAFYDTLDSAHSRVRVVRVERLEHPLLQQQYELHRARLEQRCEQRPVEHVLYHGTSVPAVPEICAYGFNRSFCGRNGTLYGQGVYFAKRASLSVQDRYSPPDAEGHKAVFVARVLTGDYGLGHRQLRAPPLRAPGHGLLRYDSAVDCLRQPSIFVIFHDTQALPTHLITCEHIRGAPHPDPSGLSGPSPAS
ncbi:protein mono-ADP-ribosyltransferase PARP10 isoform X1 [Pipistrellus kuhlii]|uniref:protein mono-ADP-ribosyltransferase PARP10 isoform X1 n=1 Tax=Pipistrellus kuhlii TaxID=59472 RepID=UPI00174F0030|nr:protein mono-ADP-ribosyltransferase PARP10 isoform X1 [Pipistrellus kuhlii]XP_045431870.1 protein mono-ADP-ribosyltransferase PARP10 isoform X1 [Pipistrellus kuhlii]